MHSLHGLNIASDLKPYHGAFCHWTDTYKIAGIREKPLHKIGDKNILLVLLPVFGNGTSPIEFMSRCGSFWKGNDR
jgi:hypothetical protein